MYTIIFKHNDGTLQGHVCPTKEIRSQVIEDVMHHQNGSITEWRGACADGWDIVSEYGGTIDSAPEYMRIEWA
jgi:hypothetical protein